jgi:hypothetical protein
MISFNGLLGGTVTRWRILEDVKDVSAQLICPCLE